MKMRSMVLAVVMVMAYAVAAFGGTNNVVEVGDAVGLKATGSFNGGEFYGSETYGTGVYGIAWNYGGLFESPGTSGGGTVAGIGVRGKATATGSVINYGGYFEAGGASGSGVAGFALDGQYGGYFVAGADYSIGVRALSSSSLNGIGVSGVTGSANGIGVKGFADGANSVGVQGWGVQYNFYASNPNATHYGTASSGRWKTNIQDIDKALDKVLNLRGVYFDWDKGHGGAHGMGFIAEEVGRVIPEIVAFEADKVHANGVDYGAITPVLVQAIKEQQKIIEEKETRIARLEKALTELVGRVAFMEIAGKEIASK